MSIKITEESAAPQIVTSALYTPIKTNAIIIFPKPENFELNQWLLWKIDVQNSATFDGGISHVGLARILTVPLSGHAVYIDRDSSPNLRFNHMFFRHPATFIQHNLLVFSNKWTRMLVYSVVERSCVSSTKTILNFKLQIVYVRGRQIFLGAVRI